MAREIDEAFIDEAMERYRRSSAQLAEFDKAVRGVEVTVRSPDGLVEVVVTPTARSATCRSTTGSSAESGRRFPVGPAAVTAAADAAAWARQKLHAESFGDYHAVGRS